MRIYLYYFISIILKIDEVYLCFKIAEFSCYNKSWINGNT